MTILNTVEMTLLNNGAWTSISAIVLFVSLGVLLLSVDGSGWLPFVSRVLFGLALISILVSVETSSEYKTGEIHYEAILNESISARAILEEYEIVGIRGDIYTLKPLDVAAEDKP